jgi:hypothetical protein
MNKRTKTQLIVTVSTLMVSLFVTANSQAETMEGVNSLYYSNRAYVHAIPDEPNPVSDSKVNDAQIVYVDKAYGQATFSYPGNVRNSVTDFNVEYVDTAYGQAIYSYPSNVVKHRLDLVDNVESSGTSYNVPVSFEVDKLSFR